MRVIFLDVDGVLAHKDTLAEKGDTTFDTFWNRIDKECLVRLKYALDATGAKVVVSSAWRRNEVQMDVLRDLLAGYIVGRTGIAKAPPDSVILEPTRGREITTWLQEHPQVFQYVVLDDSLVKGHPQVHVKNGWSTGGLKAAHVFDIATVMITGAHAS